MNFTVADYFVNCVIKSQEIFGLKNGLMKLLMDEEASEELKTDVKEDLAIAKEELEEMISCFVEAYNEQINEHEESEFTEREV